MHYGNSEQIEKQKLQVVIYTHRQGDTNDNYFQLTSLQNCQFVNPRLLSKFFASEKKSQAYFASFPQLAGLEQEKWWHVEFKETEGAFGNFLVVESVEDVSKHADDIYRLH